ncbi:hypothetical protein R3Q06_18705 [Rhodococcus erythropolis]|uniref:hypothetical protein n=1 Tax=Rhodococcus erythropolis TaxID=1833 RepID=UPI002949222B|nr:hypothetical protein [Rhodococcus erythropolis]MDV6275531.1 hypothetical protein [Rhodococcus erythropolis]
MTSKERRAVPADELDSFVDRFARNVANLPDGVVAAAKRIFAPISPLEGYQRREISRESAIDH